MTGGGGFALLVSLVAITTVYGRLKECSPIPPWTVNGISPMSEAKGNVSVLALMKFSSQLCQHQAIKLDVLLRDLHDYGMYDLSFMAINSKEAASNETLDRIQSMLAYPIYQEQNDEEIWNSMDGDTNDIFVFDRCGRLTYLISFPLSDLRNKATVVRAAVLSTYFRSPCGSTCINHNADNIQDFIQEEIVDNTESDEIESQNIIQYNNTDMNELADAEDKFQQFENKTNANDEIIIEEDNYETNDFNPNNTLPENISSENISSENQNITIQKPSPTKKSFLSSFLEFLGIKKETEKNPKFSETTEKISLRNIENETYTEVNDNDYSYSPISSEENNEIFPIITTDRCGGVDENLCSEWSKSKLLHAQRCCLLGTQNDRVRKGCKNLGRKRCKKIQPILKCCLKTEMQLPLKDKLPIAM